MHKDELLNSRQVAEILECSTWTVGRFPPAVLPVAVKAPGVRGARLYRRGDVDKLVKAKAACAHERTRAISPDDVQCLDCDRVIA